MNIIEPSQCKDRLMLELVETLNDLAYYYYVKDDPRASDAEYDELYSKLVDMEQEQDCVLSNSPTRRVADAPLKVFEQHKHLAPLFSLDKCKTQDELRAWYARTCKILEENCNYPVDSIRCAVEFKFDGLTINLTYEGGKLVMATTRGNGEAGEVVTEQVRTIRSIPLVIPFTGRMECQGEGIMKLSTLKKYNEKAAVPLKNARNGVAGAIRNLDPKITAARHLSAFFYNIGYIDDGRDGGSIGMHPDGFHSAQLEFLRANRILTSPIMKVCNTLDEIFEVIKEIEDMRHELDFDIDGVVIKVCDLRAREALGFTNRFPRWAMAWKFEAEEKTTRLLDITWQVGRTGKLTPVGILEPVTLAGATVQRATLNNWDDIIRKNVKIGGRVFIRRSNDVIPEITGSVENPNLTYIEYDPVKPDLCPACGWALIEYGAHRFCTNKLGCPPQIIGAMTNFCSRDGMDIDGLSEGTIEPLYNAGLVTKVSDLYKLHLVKDKMAELPLFGQKKVEKVLAAIEASKKPSLRNFIFALGIPNSGDGTAKRLAQAFNTFTIVRNATYSEFLSVRDIGEDTAHSIADFFQNPANQQIIDEMLRAGVTPQDEAGASGTALRGMTVVITGTLPTLGRKEAEGLVEANGGHCSGSVSKNTSFVLVGEDAGSKYDKAKQLGVRCVSEEEFLAMIK